MLVTTELSSNFRRLATQRPRSARDEFRKRRDNLKTGGQQQGTFQAENKTSFIEHKSERPKIYKPRLCTDCHDDGEKVVVSTNNKSKIGSSDTKATFTAKSKANTEFVTPSKEILQFQPKPDQQFKGNTKIAQESQHSVIMREREPDSDQQNYQYRHDLWPPWSSRPPVELGEHVRSVFLDLCDGKTMTELQVGLHFHIYLIPYPFYLSGNVSSSMGRFRISSIPQP